MAWTKEKRAKYIRERRRKRCEQHICVSCDSKTDGKTRCDRCSVIRSRKEKLLRETKKSQGLCTRCGCVVKSGKIWCVPCLASAKPPRKKRRESRIKKGLCGSCGATTSGQKTCEPCLVQHIKWTKQRKISLVNAGLCCQCGKFPPICGVTRYGNPHSVCQICYLKSISQVNLGSSKYANFLLEKLKHQNYKCPYTGCDLILGGNAWVDHIMSRAKFPELAKDINNIEWISEDVNRMKQDKTPDEFLAIIKQIHEYRVSE